MNIDDVVFVLKYILIGPQTPLENKDNNFSENRGEDENELDDPNAHFVNHFLEILGYDEGDNDENFYIVKHPYSTRGKIQSTQAIHSTSKIPPTNSKINPQKDNTTFDLEYDHVEYFTNVKLIYLYLNIENPSNYR